MKEYIVALNKGVDYDAFWNEIENLSEEDGFVPSRRVDIANNRTLLTRICEYWLTDAEAEILKNDPRVLSVEIPVRNNPNVFAVSNTTQNISGMNYTKQAGNIVADYVSGGFSSSAANYTPPLNASTNWGLIRHSFQSNPYGANPTGASNSTTTELYNYVLNGSNVDVIINDSGIQADHPEFAGRITNVDWDSIATTLGIPVTGWNTASYTDTDGHGTCGAGIIAGETYGWAKGANIIPLYWSAGGQSSADPLDTFEMMIYWHQNKGTNNPTVVNMSWDLRFSFPAPYNSGMSYCNYYFSGGGSYRGTPWTGTQTDSFFQSRGLIALTGNGWPGQGAVLLQFPYSSTAYNTALGDVIDAGIVVCQAAANNGFKIDVPGGDDYNNYVTSGGTYYYHRGASPKDPRAIVVGALDTKTSASAQDQRAQYSCAGPGVDIWAAGTYIMSAGCTNPAPGSSQALAGDADYYLDTNYNEVALTGTSFASPQIAGMSALYLQAHPLANIYNANNCSTVKSWLVNNATTNTFNSTGNATTYTDGTSLLGGNATVAYQSIQGITQIKDSSNNWVTVANVYVKTDSTTWTQVQNIYTKTDSSTWKQTYTAS
jgi:hypothetical protein